MAAPITYTEEALSLYMMSVLGPVASMLDWLTTPAYDEAVSETLLAYGVGAIASVTGAANIKKLRTLARREAWRAVVQATVTQHDFSEAGASYSLSQIHEQALAALKLADADALAYDPNYRIGVDKITRPHDPYSYVPDDERLRP